MDSREKNRIQLKKGLQQLPQYKAPDNWDALQQQLDLDKSERPLKEAIRELPTRTAPDFIWSNIEQHLAGASKAKVRRMSFVRWAAAAAIVGLCSILILREPPMAYAESIKYQEINLTPVAWNGDNPAAQAHVETVLAAASAQEHTWAAPATQAIKGSLDLLNQAIAQVETAGEMGGLNEQMKSQLTKMFIKRNQLVRQLAANI